MSEGNNENLLSAVDALSIVHNMPVPSAVGALHLQNEQGTKSGKLFFKEGDIYAAEVDGHGFPYAERVKHSGLVDEEEVRSVVSSVAGNVCHPHLENLFLERHLVDAKTTSSYLRENFLSVAGLLLSLNPVRAEWKENDYTENFIVNYIKPDKLVSLVNQRKQYLQELLTAMETDEETFFSSPIVMSRELVTSEEWSAESLWVLHQAQGEQSVDQIANHYGFTRFFVARTIYNMWKSGLVEVTKSNTIEAEDVDAVVLTEGTADRSEITEEFADNANLEEEDTGVSYVEEDEFSFDEEDDTTVQDLTSNTDEQSDPFGIYDEDEADSSDQHEDELPLVEDDEEDPLESSGEDDVQVSVAPAVQAPVDDDDEEKQYQMAERLLTSLHNKVQQAEAHTLTILDTLETARDNIKTAQRESAEAQEKVALLREELSIQEASQKDADERLTDYRRQEEEAEQQLSDHQKNTARNAERLKRLTQWSSSHN